MSEHKHNCDCGSENCNCHEEEVTVTLTLDNDEELECVVLTIFDVGERSYIALLPNDDDNEDGDVFIYRYAEIDGEPTLDNIEDDDEYEAAADAFDEWLDSLEYDELAETEE